MPNNQQPFQCPSQVTVLSQPDSGIQRALSVTSSDIMCRHAHSTSRACKRSAASPACAEELRREGGGSCTTICTAERFVVNQALPAQDALHDHGAGPDPWRYLVQGAVHYSAVPRVQPCAANQRWQRQCATALGTGDAPVTHCEPLWPLAGVGWHRLLSGVIATPLHLRSHNHAWPSTWRGCGLCCSAAR